MCKEVGLSGVLFLADQQKYHPFCSLFFKYNISRVTEFKCVLVSMVVSSFVY